MLLDGKIAGELVLYMTCFIALSAFRNQYPDLESSRLSPWDVPSDAMGAYAFCEKDRFRIDVQIC